MLRILNWGSLLGRCCFPAWRPEHGDENRCKSVLLEVRVRSCPGSLHGWPPRMTLSPPGLATDGPDSSLTVSALDSGGREGRVTGLPLGTRNTGTMVLCLRPWWVISSVQDPWVIWDPASQGKAPSLLLALRGHPSQS